MTAFYGSCASGPETGKHLARYGALDEWTADGQDRRLWPGKNGCVFCIRVEVTDDLTLLVRDGQSWKGPVSYQILPYINMPVTDI